MRRKRRHLVTQHLENVSRKILAKYPEIIREFASYGNGIYALYRKDRLYYLGLATNLRQRLKQHLHDQHAQTWDRLSL
ncbi:MAG: GIY-YIG nuclease family protein, partial [Armatimonadetes bacterium]|nr:GIY-YIG nuclease family protein [Armatimonadota bacterium]